MARRCDSRPPTNPPPTDRGPGVAIARLVIAQRPGFSVMRVPRLQIDDAELRTLSLDPRAGFLISLFDGESTVASILDACGEVMTRKEALIMLNELIVRGVIALE